MTPRSLKRAAAIISERDDEHSRAEQSPRKENDFNVTVLQVSPSKRIVMSADGTVTLLDKLATTVVSTSENRETKILALESILGLLRQNDERDLHPNCESPVVAQRSSELSNARKTVLTQSIAVASLPASSSSQGLDERYLGRVRRGDCRNAEKSPIVLRGVSSLILMLKTSNYQGSSDHASAKENTGSMKFQ